MFVLIYRPSQLDYDPSRTKWEDENVWKSSSLTSDVYHNNGLSQIRRHYDNRYSHRRQDLVSKADVTTTGAYVVRWRYEFSTRTSLHDYGTGPDLSCSSVYF